MGLERLVEGAVGAFKTIKDADERILATYTRLCETLKLDTGGAKYYICGMLNALSIGYVFYAGEKVIGRDPTAMTVMVLHQFDLTYNVMCIGKSVDEQVTTDTLAADPQMQPYKQFNALFRFPTFLAGVGFAGWGVLEMISKTVEKGADEMYLGVGFLAAATSMYFKSTDPSLLQKQSILSGVKELFSSPVPILAEIRK